MSSINRDILIDKFYEFLESSGHLQGSGFDTLNLEVYIEFIESLSTNSQKFYVPELGDRIQLTQDWNFGLHHERRNQKLLEFFGHKLLCKFIYERETGKKLLPVPVCLPKGTILKVDRVYIRKGAKDYSSISFYIDSESSGGSYKKRFWTKLEDCNQMMYQKICKHKL